MLGGIPYARQFQVVARRLEELVVWQLGDELREKVYALIETTDAVRDFRFRDQLRDATSSITRNAAEGFGRYRHKEFAQFLTISRGSMFEVADLLRDGVLRRHWTSETVRDLLHLCDRTIGATTSLIIYLRENPDL